MTSQPGADQVVILAAGRAARGRAPSAVVDTGPHGRVLDWILEAFGALSNPDLCVVAGYRAEEIIERYPQPRVVLNRDWETTGAAHSLAVAGLQPGTRAFVSYSDIVFRAEAVRRLSEASGDICIAIDTQWRVRYDGRSRGALDRAEKVRLAGSRVTGIGSDLASESSDAEYAGVMRLNPAGVVSVNRALQQLTNPKAGIPALLRILLDEGATINAVDLNGAWAELDAQQDLARFVLGTKAESLERLRPMRHGGVVSDLVTATWHEWLSDEQLVIDRVLAAMPLRPLIVRSSAVSEDTWNESAAGVHESVLDVVPERDAVCAAIRSVFASYRIRDPLNQVLVQPMLRDVATSGVVMSRTHAFGAPYYVVNFDDVSARTDAVTAGRDARTVIVHRSAAVRADWPALPSVLTTVRKIEALVGHDSLDIEFATTGDGAVHILQVRPISVNHQPDPTDDQEVADALASASVVLERKLVPSQQLCGTRGRFSVMTDWNPAEIIGTKPRRLATSLYRYLITDEVWATQRAEYGYRDVRPTPLLVEFAGHPYVDVRASFNSFVPAALDEHVTSKLVDHYLNVLAESPELHDKVEFEIVPTCLTSQIATRSDSLQASGLSNSEISAFHDALRDITVGAFTRIEADIADMEMQRARITALREQQRGAPDAYLDHVYESLELARRGATLTFAHLARAAFIATDLLRGFVATGVVTQPRVDDLLKSIPTVFSELQGDAGLVKAGELAFDEFVDRYGHLRPGTYDITSPCYRNSPDTYLAPLVDRATDDATRSATPFHWTSIETLALTRELEALRLPSEVDRFTRFVRLAIYGREEAKFVFTAALSDALESIAQFAAGAGLTRDDVAHVSINDILLCRDAMLNPRILLESRVREGREAFRVTQSVCLPTQLCDVDDLVCYEQHSSVPNFITHRSVEAVAVTVDGDPPLDIEAKIVLIPSADPGYDSLLSRGIAGLITMFGGANSHMAVRAAEMGLPAAIGVGDRTFATLRAANIIRLDCATRSITVVN